MAEPAQSGFVRERTRQLSREEQRRQEAYRSALAAWTEFVLGANHKRAPKD